LYILNLLTVSDVHDSHGNVTFFSDKKRQKLNEKKCVVLPVNTRKHDCFPILKVNGKEMKIVSTAVYLGDVFNYKGNNQDLVSDRVARGMMCLVTSFALISDVSMGCYCVLTLLMLYRCMFVPSVLFNSEVWTRLTTEDIRRLEVVQLKFLKRIFHVPSSTSNAATVLEVGVLPVVYEIEARKLKFLHHILNLDEDDPVKLVYFELGKYPFEGNWTNEVNNLLTKYEIDCTDITEISKDCWKNRVMKAVKIYALQSLNAIVRSQSKTKNYPEVEGLVPQPYLWALNSKCSRLLFSARTGVMDLKALRRYAYDDSSCRLCGGGEESVDHVLNRCAKVTRGHTTVDIYTNDLEEMREAASRLEDFVDKLSS
jgi:hypothetical protein